ncbi:NAD(P)-dependent oxidoreductase, partial [Oceanispirochaeta sp.]|uniref:NAD(P)-dependent oxidoreductase n=1 Tax=Oceanispirochaeta sp. TaxID=2035350 RepID=UPI00261FE29F
MKPNSIILMDPRQVNHIFGPEQLRQIRDMTELLHPPMSGDEALSRPYLLEKVDFIFSGWGMCPVDEGCLRIAKNLKAIFYGAGTVRGFMSDALLDSDIPVTTAYAANAVPVAEFTFAQIILALKKALYFTRISHENHRWERERSEPEAIAGCFGSTVGLVSLGMIGTKVLALLQHLDVKIKVFDIVRNDELAA